MFYAGLKLSMLIKQLVPVD